MTDDGLVFNGNVYYLGFTPTAQTASGTVTVRGGPDATYAVIHQVASPVTGTTYYASGVDPEDSLTWIECASLYTTHSGTSQTVDYILGDRE